MCLSFFLVCVLFYFVYGPRILLEYELNYCLYWILSGCVMFVKCYWSSQPSPVAEKDEWLEYEMVSEFEQKPTF